MVVLNDELTRHSQFFEGLDAAAIELVSGIFVEKKLAAGMTVFIENMPGESLYVVVEGTIRLTRMLAEGDERTLAVLGAGDFFGEMAVIEGACRAVTARVLEDAQLLVMTRESFQELSTQYPEVGILIMKNIMKLFSRRLRQNSDEYREMMLFALASVE